MTPAKFIAKWGDSQLRERQGSQEHFIDLCRLLDVPTPAEDDNQGDRYCFERGAEKVGGGDGWADVWRRGCFGWEYKGKHKDLNAALRQLQAYALDLENPPYLVVSDMERIVVHTNWTNTVSKKHEFALDDLLDPAKLHVLRAVFDGSEELKPRLNPQELTAKVAARFGELSTRLQDRGYEPRAVAHFLNRLVFCMFAEDAGLLPKKLFSRTMKATQARPEAAQGQLADLFDKMARPGDTYFGADFIRWFNGGLFNDAETLPLERADLELIAETADEHDWSEIDPSVFGTLFEGALSARRERKALGAHYTDREKILQIVGPVVVRPLAAEWAAVLAEARAAMTRVDAANAESQVLREAASEQMKLDPGAARASEGARRRSLAAITRRRDAAKKEAHALVEAWLERLAAFRVLDPACGSGNFLYVALHELMDLEQRAIVDAERLGLEGFLPRVDLRAVRGIEIERYAAELARLTLWIGYLQWVLKKAAKPPPDPVLSALDQIENRDALLNPDGTEAEWPPADAIIGNPPFLGDKRQRSTLALNDLDAIRNAFSGRLPASANLVMYWFFKAGRHLDAKLTQRIGLVSTQAIRRGASSAVLREILSRAHVFEAWSNEEWVVDGAEVRVSVVCIQQGEPHSALLDGAPVSRINADLTADMATVAPSTLRENLRKASQGTISGGPFEIAGADARTMLQQPVNPNGRPNSDVVRPWRNGDDITGRPSDYWIIDFGDLDSVEDVSLFEAPYELLERQWRQEQERRLARGERPLREGEPRSAALWWRLQRRRSPLLAQLSTLERYIATPRVSKHRFFVWLSSSVVPDTRLVVVPRDDDCFFGLLSSRFHEIWSIRFGARHGVGNDPEYVHTKTFETFPFPAGLTPDLSREQHASHPHAAPIAEAARQLSVLREAWLNPTDLIVSMPEVAPGLPDRISPRDGAAAETLKQRTLTNLYNERPTWLVNAHLGLDAAVAAAYGWPANLSDEESLERLFALNQERSG